MTSIGLQPNFMEQKEVSMKKTISAFLAAVVVTTLLAGAMFLIGQDAFGTSTARAAAVSASAATSPEAVAQYEQVVSQYQQRETQYQAEIAQATEQINAANQQIHQYQSLLEQLQSMGLISITGDGSVMVNPMSQPGFLPSGDRRGGDDS